MRAMEVEDYNTRTSRDVGPWWFCMKTKWSVWLEELDKRLEGEEWRSGVGV